MSSVVIDVTTRGLDETIKNLGELPAFITTGVARKMEMWYNQHYKKTVLKIIETGGNTARIPKNFGRYAQQKGTTQPLGIISGKLFLGVASTKPSIKETRGKEVRFSIVYKKPFYLAYVHEGFIAGGFAAGTPVPARPFVEVARNIELPKLFKMIGDLFEGLDLTSTVLGGR